MTRTLFVAVATLVVLVPARSQTLGILAMACTRDVYAAGYSVAPTHGMSVGMFAPFYVFDRFVLRTEAGIGAWSGMRTASDASTHAVSALGLRAAVLGRYYVARRAAFSLGADLEMALSEREPILIGRTMEPQERTDIGVLVGAAYRLNDRLELGCRFIQGVTTAVRMGPFGDGHQRSAAITASYVVHSRHPRFRQVRMWRAPSYIKDPY